MMTRVNGQDIKMTFADHPHTSPEYQRDLSRLAARAGVGTNVAGLKNAYYSEKHRQVVVDVHSDRKDPLGNFNRAARAAPPPKLTKRHVGQTIQAARQEMTHPGERPHIPINRQSAPGRIPVPSSIGAGNASHAQPSRTVEDIANLVYGDSTTQSLLDADTLKGMPQWALALMNQNRLMSIELATFYQIMIDRGMLTTHEISRYRRAIQVEHDINFQRMVDQLGRQLKQQPNPVLSLRRTPRVTSSPTRGSCSTTGTSLTRLTPVQRASQPR